MKKLFSFLAFALLTIGGTMYAANYYVAGNGTAGNPWCNGISWNPSAPENKLVDGQIVYKDVPAGVYEFKITNGSWSQSWGAWTVDAACSDPGYEGTDNVKLTTAITQDITISFDGAKICVKGQFGGKVEISSYTIVGNAVLLGTNWDTNNSANDLSKQESGVWTLTKKEISLPVGTYEYKVVGNHSYSVFEYPTGEGGNNSLSITKPGIYDVVFTFNPATPDLSAKATFIREDGELPQPEYFLAGWINGADCQDETYKFVDGKLTTKFEQDSYVYVRSGNTHYLTEAYVDFAEAGSATLKAGNMEKMGVRGKRDVEFTLVDNGDGTLTLSYKLEAEIPSSLDKTMDNDVRYSVLNQELRLAFAGEQSVMIRSLTGQLIDHAVASNTYTRQMQQGIYIVSVGQTTLKVVVK